MSTSTYRRNLRELLRSHSATHRNRKTAECVRSDLAVPPRRWRTIPQISDAYPAFSQPAIRSLIRKSRPHYDHRGEWVEGNGLAHAICQPGGKNGKIMLDEIGFGEWLESWAGAIETTNGVGPE